MKPYGQRPHSSLWMKCGCRYCSGASEDDKQRHRKGRNSKRREIAEQVDEMNQNRGE